MVSVRLLKDEKEASRRLSEFAEKEIDHHAVARKRATISKKLVPWLLRHFSQDATKLRLKIIAAQFLFYLLQGDEGAKMVLSSAAQSECWSLGRALKRSDQLPLRILAANILREMSLAKADLSVFCQSKLLSTIAVQLPSRFIADDQWLLDTVTYLENVDNHGSVPEESRVKTHKVLSLSAGPLSFSEAGSTILATVTDHLFFIIPAEQNMPLQILECHPIDNMKIEQCDVSGAEGELSGERVKIRLTMDSTGGYYILSGVKSDIDHLNLAFLTNDDCDTFCEALINSQNSSSDSSLSRNKPQTKKQSRAMVNLSQKFVLRDDRRKSSPPNNSSRKVSRSQLIDMSASRESSISARSPIRQETGIVALIAGSQDDGEPFIHDTKIVNEDLCRPTSGKIDADLCHSAHSKLRVDDVGRGMEQRKEPSRSPAPPPQSFRHRSATPQPRSPVGTPAACKLQHMVTGALQSSTTKPIKTLDVETDSIGYLEGSGAPFGTVLSRQHNQRPLLKPRAKANLAKRMAPAKKKSESTPVAKTNRNHQHTEENIRGAHDGRSAKPKPNSAAFHPVDWDEDLRPNSDEDRHPNLPPERSKGSKLYSAGKFAKKHPATKPAKPSGIRKKAHTKANIKENTTQKANVDIGLAATRSRRPATSVSYVEQSEPGEKSRNTIHEVENTNSHADVQRCGADAPSLTMDDDHLSGNGQSIDNQSPANAPEKPGAILCSPTMSVEDTVEIFGSEESTVAAAAVAAPTTQHKLVGNLQSDQPVLGPPSPHAQKPGTHKISSHVLRPNSPPSAESVNGSHSMNKHRPPNAVKEARKSFGSALTDIMNANGLQPEQDPFTVGRSSKPFGDKTAFIDSVKSARQRSPIKSDSKTRRAVANKHVQALSMSKGMPCAAAAQDQACKFVLPASPHDENAPEQYVSSNQSNEAVGAIDLLQTESAAISKVSCGPSEGQGGSLSHILPTQLEIDQTAPSRELSENVRDVGTSSSSAHKSPGKSNQFAQAEVPPRGTPKAGSETTIPNHQQTTRTPTESDDTQLAGLAQKPRTIMKRSLRNEALLQDSAPVSLPNAENPDSSTYSKHQISNPQRQGSTKTRKSGDTSATPLMSQRRSAREIPSKLALDGYTLSKSADKKVKNVFSLPQHGAEIGRSLTPRNNPRDRSADLDGPNGIGLPEDVDTQIITRTQDTRQLSPLPTETEKHLAFKRLHISTKAIKPPEDGFFIPARLHGFNKGLKMQTSATKEGFKFDKSAAGEEHVDQSSPISTPTEFTKGKIASQTSKVDENGSPRLHLAEKSRSTSLSNESASSVQSYEREQSVASTSIAEGTSSDNLGTKESISFDLRAAISRYRHLCTRKAVKLKSFQVRPSIGVGKLLDHNFPQSNRSIATDAFRTTVLDATALSIAGSDSPKQNIQPGRNKGRGRRAISFGPCEGASMVHQDDGSSFDIQRLNVSVDTEVQSSEFPALARRLRSGSPLSPGGEPFEQIASPQSFSTRLVKMSKISAPQDPRENGIKPHEPKEHQLRPYKGLDQSIMIDAETTLVSGKVFEDGTTLSPLPKARGRISSSSSSDEGSGSGARPSVNDIQRDVRFWDQKVAEAQQTVLELLDQVSNKLLLRFSKAEDDITFKLDQYRYGGHKILNNFVEQFDKRVAQEKQIPNSLLNGYQKRLDDAIGRLQQARKRVRAAPSLDDLQKSHEVRSNYVLTNLEKFQQQMQAQL